MKKFHEQTISSLIIIIKYKKEFLEKNMGIFPSPGTYLKSVGQYLLRIDLRIQWFDIFEI